LAAPDTLTRHRVFRGAPEASPEPGQADAARPASVGGPGLADIGAGQFVTATISPFWKRVKT
jgi:hypothetical protein